MYNSQIYTAVDRRKFKIDALQNLATFVVTIFYHIGNIHLFCGIYIYIYIIIKQYRKNL